MEHPASIPSEAVVAVLPVPALLVGPDGLVLASNVPAMVTFGIPDTAIGNPLFDLALARRVPELRDAVAAATRGGSPPPLTIRAFTTTRGIRTLTVTVSPILPAAGGPSAVLLTAQEIAENDDGARLGEDAGTRFLAMVAHELRNPLGVIAGALHLIRQRARGDRLVDRARLIAERQLRHQSRLLEDLLDVSRLRTGTIELHQETVDLAEVLKEAIDSAHLAAQLNTQALTLAIDPGRLLVHGDRTRLDQLIRNLLDNAIKYTGPGGRVAVRATIEAGAVVVRVTDTGIGIDPEGLDHIFEPFVRGDVSAARSRGGLGVGLSLVRAFAELHGGSVQARSTGRGRGSEFELRLALDTTPVPPSALAAPPVPAASRLHARHILVVEDDRDAREVLRLVFELDGHKVETAADGVTAVRLAAASAPDVVLIDIGLPELDGYEVARRIRKRLGRAVRLVALTGYGDPEARRRVRDAGFDAHVVKPIAPDDLGRLLTG